MNKNTSKILIILLLALIFVAAGYYLRTKMNIQHSTSNNEQLLPSPTPFPPPANLTQAKVLRVIDGDTIELTDKTRVRYIGINTPELATDKQPGQCYATEAAHLNQQLVEGQEVGLEKDTADSDKYGRLLRYVYIDNIFVNDFLLRQGFARIETIPPDVKYSQILQSAEKEARGDHRGLWGKCVQ